MNAINWYLETYVNIMNYLDDKALSGKLLDKVEIDQLNRNIEKYSIADSATEFIRDIADANDCGDCKSWNELILALKDLFENGERIPIKSVTK